MEEWINLDHLGFSDYSVSNYGEIRNDNTGRILRHSQNQSGSCKIGMIQSNFHNQETLSVALIVANEFLPDPRNSNFDTPINLDGDRNNNRADNLMWRPRWFAVKYHLQFHNDLRGFNVPVIELHTGEEFGCSWDAAMKYGLIDRDILIAKMNHGSVFPTGQQFTTIYENDTLEL